MPSYILITGALGGLGSALAHECARRGYHLYLTDICPGGEEMAHTLAKTYSIDVRYRPCELTSAEDRASLLADFKEEGCTFCGLFNVAGRDYEGEFLGRARAQLLHLVELTIAANLDLTHGILSMRDTTHRFLLINVGSLAAFFPMPFKATYSSSKRFLLNFSYALREEIKDFGNVLILCPAGLPTHAESRRKMEAQGFWGKATMMETSLVARQTLKYVLKGKALYVPGVLNRLLALLGSFLPAGLLTRFLGKRWRSEKIATAAQNKP